jgi:hypothetical protein
MMMDAPNLKTPRTQIMKRIARTTFLALTGISIVLLATLGSGAVPPDDAGQTSVGDEEAVRTVQLATIDEARARARLLHETIHATLQIFHLRYYREDEGLPLPARTLEFVFREVDRSHQVKLRWLAVNAQAMNIDHKPKDDFEKDAVKALASGKDEFELVENGVYRHVGAITLSAECLKCHVPNRTSLEDRAAGLVIAMPVKVK